MINEAYHLFKTFFYVLPPSSACMWGDVLTRQQTWVCVCLCECVYIWMNYSPVHCSYMNSPWMAGRFVHGSQLRMVAAVAAVGSCLCLQNQELWIVDDFLSKPFSAAPGTFAHVLLADTPAIRDKFLIAFEGFPSSMIHIAASERVVSEEVVLGVLKASSRCSTLLISWNVSKLEIYHNLKYMHKWRVLPELMWGTFFEQLVLRSSTAAGRNLSE